MPYKNQTLKLQIPREIDKRVKLSLDQKEEIRKLYGKISQRKLAKMFGVSRSLVIFYGCPEKHLENLKRRAERGGSKIYYDRQKQVKAAKKIRVRRQELYLNGLLRENK